MLYGVFLCLIKIILGYSIDNQWVYSVGVNYLDNGGDTEGKFSFTCAEEDQCFMNPTVKI